MAWVMLHRYRSVMVGPGRDRLRGDVEVDESFPGGSEPGVPGRGALGKVLFAGAVELDESGFGRARLGVIPNASAVSLAAFLDANVEPGSRVITDGWSPYPAATGDRYEHTGTSVAASGRAAHEVLPAVHRVFSLVKRWLMGTMQGSVSPEHVQAYFDEWVFRFNRRHSRSRGLLFHTLLRQAVEGQPVTYRSLRKTGRTRPAPQPARGARQLPPSLDVGRPELPWRTCGPAAGSHVWGYQDGDPLPDNLFRLPRRPGAQRTSTLRMRQAPTGMHSGRLLTRLHRELPRHLPDPWSAEVNPIGKVLDLGTEELLEFR